MTPPFPQTYNSKTKFLQRYIEHILQYQKQNDFAQKVWIRALRFWSLYESKKGNGLTERDIRQKIYFERVRKHLDAHFSDAEKIIVLTEKERLAELRRQEQVEKLAGHHAQELFKLRKRNLRYLEIRLLQEMGYSLKEIEDEMNLSKRQIKDTFIYQEKKNKDEEIQYLLDVLGIMQGINNHELSIDYNIGRDAVKVYMKNIEVLAWFEENGTPHPLRITIDEKELKIQKVLSVSKEKQAGKWTYIFRCQSEIKGELRLFEIKYELQTCRWILWKA